MPTAQVVFVRYAVHLLIVVALALPSGDALHRTGNPGAIALRGLALLGSTILNFWALGFLPLTMTAAIMFSMPLWVCLLSIPLLGEQRRPAPLGGDPRRLRRHPRRHPALVRRRCTGPRSLSLGAALCGALYAILTRRLAGRDSTATQQFYAALVATVGTAPVALADWDWPAGAASWVAFFAIGGFGWLSHQLMIVAHRYAPASTLAPFTYTQIVGDGRLELADLRPAAGRVGARRRRHRRGERPLHLAPRAHAFRRSGAARLVTAAVPAETD